MSHKAWTHAIYGILLVSNCGSAISSDDLVQQHENSGTLAMEHKARSVKSPKLKKLVILARHGHRKPSQFYPNYDKDFAQYGGASKMWPVDHAALTVNGMKECYELGNYLRKTYGGLIPNTYSKKAAHFQSTELDRTMESAQAVAAGLFNKQNSVDHANQNFGNLDTTLFKKWLPVPINTKTQDRDYPLLFIVSKVAAKVCPKYVAYQKKSYETPKYKAYSLKQQPFLNKIANLTGMKPNSLNVQNAWRLWDAFTQSKANGYKLPSYASDAIMEKLRKITLASTSLLYSDFEHKNLKEMTQLGAGQLLKMIQNTIKDGVDKDFGKTVENSHPKLIFYMAHDVTMAALLTALNLPHDTPNPASALIFEVMDNDFVVLKYRKSRKQPPTLLKLCNSTAGCQFDRWVGQTKDLISQNWAKECGTEKSNNAYKFGEILLSIPLACGLAIAIIWVIVNIVAHFLSRRRRRKNIYASIKVTKQQARNKADKSAVYRILGLDFFDEELGEKIKMPEPKTTNVDEVEDPVHS